MGGAIPWAGMKSELSSSVGHYPLLPEDESDTWFQSPATFASPL